MNRQLILILCTLSLHGVTQADTQIKTIGNDGEYSTITSNGNIARIDNSSEPGYVLIDTRKQQFNMVDPQRRQVTVVNLKNSKKPAQAATNQVKVSLNRIGKGPKIAGYRTDKYTLSANGRLCNTIFGSKAALNIKSMAELFDAMDTMEQSLDMMGGFRSMMDECDEANMQSAELFKAAGAPLRVIDANGQLESEVQSINSNTKVAKNFYQIPASYQQVSMQQQINQARQQMQQNMPDMNQIMQQMQQGGMSPEAMKQMQQMLNQQ